MDDVLSEIDKAMAKVEAEGQNVTGLLLGDREIKRLASAMPQAGRDLVITSRTVFDVPFMHVDRPSLLRPVTV